MSAWRHAHHRRAEVGANPSLGNVVVETRPCTATGHSCRKLLMSPTTAPAGHAVVIGAGMAGLTIATALSTAFQRVTVLDRDQLPWQAKHRSGVPQGRHVHVLLAAGTQALEALYPGLTDELTAAGAPTGDIDRLRVCLNGHRLARARTGRHGVMASRPLIEAHVHDRVRRDPAVTVIDRREVRGLATSGDRRRVTGVRIGSPGDAGEQTLAAELVVDCSGRGSPLPAWLAELGYVGPPVDELPLDLCYATCRYHVPPEVDDDLMAMVGPMPDKARGAAMMRVEDGSWLVTLAAYGEQPPLEPHGFEAFAATLASDDIYRSLVRGQALEAPSAFRFPASVRHRYEHLGDFPAGLLAAGDAVCSFNPIYGQGMTVAALEAVTLGRLLADGVTPPAQRWFAAVSAIADQPWGLALAADLALECVQGHRSLATRALNRYIARLHAAAAHDPELTRQFAQVTSLLEAPARLLRPATVARVARGALRRSTPPP